MAGRVGSSGAPPVVAVIQVVAVIFERETKKEKCKNCKKKNLPYKNINIICITFYATAN